MKTNERHMYTRLLAASLLGLFGLLGCADVDSEGGEPERSVSSPADENLVCPTGKIPWKFAASTPTNAEEYVEGDGSTADGAVALPDYSEVTISSVSCANGALYSEELLESLQDRCDGRRSCEITALCQNSACATGATSPGCTYSDATITYTCGSKEGGTSAAQTSPAASAGTFLTKNSLSCRGINENLSKASDNAGRVACVPAQCHGRTRRNSDMECVVDASMIEVVVEAEVGEIKPALETMDSFGKAILASDIAEALSTSGGVNDSALMTLEGTYDIPITVRFANDLVPDEVKFTAWLEDTYDLPSSLGGVDPRFFRCVAFGFTIKKDDPSTFSPAYGIRTYRKTIRTKFSEACDPAHVREYYKKLVDSYGQNGTPPLDTDLSQQLHISYDMEGRTVWHKDLSIFGGSLLGDSEPECSPNPVDMFYEREKKEHNRRGYYTQRLLTTYEPPNASRLVLTQEYSDRAEIGTVDIVARSTPRLRAFSNRKSTLAVDLSWYLSNMNHTNQLNFEVAKTTRDVGEGPARYLHEMRADVFVVPVVATKAERESFTPLLLGSALLTDGKVDGEFEGADDMVTQSVAVPINADSKQKLIADPNSSYYIPGKSRAFDLFYCINATDGLLRRDAYVPVWGKGPYWYRSEMRWLEEVQSGPAGSYSLIATYDLAVDAGKRQQGISTNSAHETGPFRKVWSVELENEGMHSPNSVPFKYRGCRTARQPVIIEADRFKPAITPVERVSADIPASARTFTDFSNEKKSGDSSMSGTQDNGSQETCPNNDSSDVYCSNTSNNGGRSDGEGGRPALDMTATIERTPPENGAPYPTAAIKFRGQMASFSALDLSKLGGVFGEGNTGQSRTLTFSITPNWAGIAASLNALSPSPTSEFTRTPIDKRIGLGYALGYKFMFNIGPVPVVVTFKFTVGAGVGIKVNLTFAPAPGKEYGCLGETEDCIKVYSEAKTFDAASKECVAAGGTLSEMSTQEESTRLQDALNAQGVGAAWLGAQLAYEPITASTEFRWLSDDSTFASSPSGSSVTYFSNIYSPTVAGLSPLGATPAGVFYTSAGQRLGSSPITSPLPYACTLPPADSETYFGWSTVLATSLGAGFSLEGCTPSPLVGFCLGASLNLIAATISPTIGQTFRWLYKNGESKPSARNGELKFTIPFKLSLFSGNLTAAIKIALKFFVLSFSWTIHSFDGITLAKLNLYELTLPVLEDY